MNKNDILNDGHWTREDYKQVIGKNEMKIVAEDRHIIAKGRLRELMFKHIGAGLFEVYKKLLKG